MKKTWLIILGVVALATLGIGIAVPALAHSTNGVNPATATAAADEDYLGGPGMARVATVLGLTTDELTTRLRNGETLVDIAAAQGVGTDSVIDALCAPYADHLNIQVQYGYMTQDEADQAIARIRVQAAEMMTRDFSATDGEGDWWDRMEEYCDNAMDAYGANGFDMDEMMDDMMGGFGANGFGGMMGGWNSDGSTSASRGGAGFSGGFGGGMMGGNGFSGGGMMGW